MIEVITPEQLSPPAMIRAAFDEARALAECKELIARRDEAKGEFKDAVLLLGQKLIEARRAMPDVVFSDGKKCYSRGFSGFLEKAGLTVGGAYSYMRFARDPAKLDRARRQARVGPRTRVLKEVVELLAQAPDLATARQVIQEELDAIK